MRDFLLFFAVLGMTLGTLLWWLAHQGMEETGTRYDCETGTWLSVDESGEIVEQKYPPFTRKQES